jgi:hypothetical protein
VQVHGGMGFIEETGAAQYYRDAKILTIYEGTTAIQANDLMGRKTSRDGGQTAQGDCGHRSRPPRRNCCNNGSADALAVARRLKAARLAFIDVVDFVAGNAKGSPNGVFAGSVPYLMLAGNLMAGWQMARSLLVAQEQLAAGQGRSLHGGEDRHGAVLRRPHPDPGARLARQHRRGRRLGDGAGPGCVLGRFAEIVKLIAANDPVTLGIAVFCS